MKLVKKIVSRATENTLLQLDRVILICLFLVLVIYVMAVFLIFLSSLSSIVELKYKKALAITGAAIEAPNVDALTVTP